MAQFSSVKNSVILANESLKLISSANSFNSILKKVVITNFSNDFTKMNAHFVVNEEHLNRQGTLHGGCATTIVDMMTAYNYLGHLGDFSSFPGLSVTLDVKFLTPAFEGDLIEVETCLVKRGKSLCFANALLFNKNKNGQLIASGQQILAIGMKSIKVNK